MRNQAVRVGRMGQSSGNGNTHNTMCADDGSSLLPKDSPGESFQPTTYSTSRTGSSVTDCESRDELEKAEGGI